MLAKENRLPSSVIRDVLKNGYKVREETMSLIYKKNILKLSRIGFTVPTFVDKYSTVRNRIKRVLRHSVRSLMHDIKPGWDMIFIVRRKIINEYEHKFFLENIKTLLARCGILKKNNIHRIIKSHAKNCD